MRTEKFPENCVYAESSDVEFISQVGVSIFFRWVGWDYNIPSEASLVPKFSTRWCFKRAKGSHISSQPLKKLNLVCTFEFTGIQQTWTAGFRWKRLVRAGNEPTLSQLYLRLRTTKLATQAAHRLIFNPFCLVRGYFIFFWQCLVLRRISYHRIGAKIRGTMDLKCSSLAMVLYCLLPGSRF